MLDILTKEDTIRQSQDAFRQWKDIWLANAERNALAVKARGTDIRDIMSCGRNRLAIVCATGQSLENHIDRIREAQKQEGVDVLCNDKSFLLLAQRGIKPKLVAVSDAQVSFGRWGKEEINKTKHVGLVLTATANPEWAEGWKGPLYMSVCKDSIGTENLLAEKTGCEVVLPAAANVGNFLVVVAAQVCAYSEILLVGFDYSWKPGQNYYAFSGDADGIMECKGRWQKQGYGAGIDGEMTYMSSNLTFAARWLKNYYLGQAQNLPVRIFNCSGQGILESIPEADLGRRLDAFRYFPPSPQVREEMAASRVRVVRTKTEKEMQGIFSQNAVYHMDIACVPKAVMP